MTTTATTESLFLFDLPNTELPQPELPFDTEDAPTMTATPTPAEALAAAYAAKRADRVRDVRVFAEAELGGTLLVVATYALVGSDHEGRVLLYGTPDKLGTATAYTGDAQAVTRKLAADLATAAEDVRLLPQLVPLVRNGHLLDDQLVAVEGTPTVGQVAYVYAMGRYRRGLVVKVARTRSTVAYTTASSGGRIFRKADAHADLLADPS
jgi:hypothetical protein